MIDVTALSQQGATASGSAAGARPGSANQLGILHLCTPAAFGGLEQVIESLAVAQARAGHRVRVGAVLEPEDPAPLFLDGMEDRGVGVHLLRRPHRGYVQERRLIRDLCRAVAPDIAHIHGAEPDVVHGGPPRRMGIATVSTVHGFTGGGLKNRIYEGLQRRAHRSRDAVVAVSRPQVAHLLRAGVPRERVHVVQNAWSSELGFLDRDAARTQLGLPAEGFVAGFIGRLSHEKGPDVLVDAAAELKPGASASIIGDGRAGEDLQRQAERVGAEARLRWHGSVDNAARLIRAFDVVVLSSRTEGTPMVLLEAMAAGVPVIATRVGGIPDVVGEQHALLVPPEDPVELAGAIEQVRECPAEAAGRAARALEHLETRFNPRRWVEAYDRVYRGCLTRNGSSR